MKNILYTIILSFLFSSSVFGDWEAGVDAVDKGDHKTALKEFTAAAKQGHAKAQRDLAYMYDIGFGVVPNHKKAAKWYRLAAEQGDALSQHNLGLLYAKGQGVTENYVIAYMWFNISLKNGYDAKANMDGVKEVLTSEQLEEAEQLARECIKKNHKDCG